MTATTTDPTTIPTTTAPAVAPERPDATLPLPTSLAYGLTGFYLVGVAVLLVSIALSDTSWETALIAHQLHNVDLAAVLGVLVLRRRPGHVIGWVLVGIGAFESLCLYSRAWHFLGLPAGAVVEDTFSGFFVPASSLLLIALPQLFPDGRLLSRRWRPLAWFGLLACTVLTVQFLLGGHNPEATAGFLLLGLAAVGSLVSAVLRFRASRDTQRQQFKWVIYGFAVSGTLLAIGVVQVVTVDGDTLSSSLQSLLAQGLLPVAFAVAVVRDRLYDIDVVINRTLVFATLAAFITAVYAGIVVGLGRLLPFTDGDLGLSIAATALVAVAFEPVRVRVQHRANQLVYGRRATPYEALAAMTTAVGGGTDPGVPLAEAARLLAAGTGAAAAAVWVARDGRLDPVGSVGPATAPVPLDGGALPTMPGADLVVPVEHEGALVGALSLAKRPGEGVSSADRQLVAELAGQATLLLANTRLRARLSDRLVELRASRRRLLAAQDEARHALERNLHDGAQQEVVALKIKLGLARTLATREDAPELAERLAATGVVADRAVETLREVARGIYPPLLESDGLGAALGAVGRRAEVLVTVLDRGTSRYPREVEATAYFCAVEAVANTAAHAHASQVHVELGATEEQFTLTATDDGLGFDPATTPRGAGLTHMIDRAQAAGGSLVVTSRPAHGTTVTLTLTLG